MNDPDEDPPLLADMYLPNGVTIWIPVGRAIQEMRAAGSDEDLAE